MATRSSRAGTSRLSITRARSTHSSAASGRFTVGAGGAGGGGGAARSRPGHWRGRFDRRRQVPKHLRGHARPRMPVRPVPVSRREARRRARRPWRASWRRNEASSSARSRRPPAPIGGCELLQIARETLTGFHAVDEDDVSREEPLIALHVVARPLVEADEVGERPQRHLVSGPCDFTGRGLAQLSQTRFETRGELIGAPHPEVGRLARRRVRRSPRLEDPRAPPPAIRSRARRPRSTRGRARPTESKRKSRTSVPTMTRTARRANRPRRLFLKSCSIGRYYSSTAAMRSPHFSGDGCASR